MSPLFSQAKRFPYRCEVLRQVSTERRKHYFVVKTDDASEENPCSLVIGFLSEEDISSLRDAVMKQEELSSNQRGSHRQGNATKKRQPTPTKVEPSVGSSSSRSSQVHSKPAHPEPKTDPSIDSIEKKAPKEKESDSSCDVSSLHPIQLSDDSPHQHFQMESVDSLRESPQSFSYSFTPSSSYPTQFRPAPPTHIRPPGSLSTQSDSLKSLHRPQISQSSLYESVSRSDVIHPQNRSSSERLTGGDQHFSASSFQTSTFHIDPVGVGRTTPIRSRQSYPQGHPDPHPQSLRQHASQLPVSQRPASQHHRVHHNPHPVQQEHDTIRRERDAPHTRARPIHDPGPGETGHPVQRRYNEQQMWEESCGYCMSTYGSSHSSSVGQSVEQPHSFPFPSIYQRAHSRSVASPDFQVRYHRPIYGEQSSYGVGVPSHYMPQRVPQSSIPEHSRHVQGLYQQGEHQRAYPNRLEDFPDHSYDRIPIQTDRHSSFAQTQTSQFVQPRSGSYSSQYQFMGAPMHSPPHHSQPLPQGHPQAHSQHHPQHLPQGHSQHHPHSHPHAQSHSQSHSHAQSHSLGFSHEYSHYSLPTADLPSYSDSSQVYTSASLPSMLPPAMWQHLQSRDQQRVMRTSSSSSSPLYPSSTTPSSARTVQSLSGRSSIRSSLEPGGPHASSIDIPIRDRSVVGPSSHMHYTPPQSHMYSSYSGPHHGSTSSGRVCYDDPSHPHQQQDHHSG
ncbi:hypothetical protein ADUPG1_003928 [Aduncisulcus paluster]|uniref:Uncharacterized protein n=1 Tax=Aduncisulcus paluster TaxID=2918883 RepID=A0ABQ5JQR7_9EUKA|nr:hypothetical protein ADUPG1_003928 [Aduncisulcus paluster]